MALGVLGEWCNTPNEKTMSRVLLAKVRFYASAVCSCERNPAMQPALPHWLLPVILPSRSQARDVIHPRCASKTRKRKSGRSRVTVFQTISKSTLNYP